MNYREIINRVFAKLGKEKQLKEYQECIYKILGIVIDFISAEGVSLKLSRGQHFHPLCEVLRGTENGCELCRKQDDKAASYAKSSGKSYEYNCHAGFFDIVVPLFDKNGVYLGCLSSGQFYIDGKKRPEEKDFASLSELTGISSAELYSYCKNTITLTEKQIEGVIAYLDLMGQLIVSTHHNLMFMESVNAPDRILAVQNYIHENFSQPLTVESVAKKFFFSANYFSRVFRKEIGIGFNAYLNCYRVDKAKEMLEETELSIGEIAFICGFGSISQFNRVFKCVADITPRDFRNRLNNHL
jgi:AraC-like DNA-binding protein